MQETIPRSLSLSERVTFKPPIICLPASQYTPLMATLPHPLHHHHPATPLILNPTPSPGFIVIIPLGTTSRRPISSPHSNPPTSTANKHRISALANSCPIHPLGPCRKVK